MDKFLETHRMSRSTASKDIKSAIQNLPTKTLGPDDFTSKSYQNLKNTKSSSFPIFFWMSKCFQFYKVSITLVPKPEKLQAKIPQQNTSKQFKNTLKGSEAMIK